MALTTGSVLCGSRFLGDHKELTPFYPPQTRQGQVDFEQE
jgi:hypothetical protein